MNNLPILTSERLILRSLNINDASDMFDYAKRDNVGPKAGWKPHETIEETKEIISKMVSEFFTDDNIGIFAIVDKSSLKMIGTLGLHRLSKRTGSVELGYVLNPDYWGRGLMVEAVTTVIPWIFNDLNLYRLECCHHDYNHQSKRVIEKLGFTFEGIARKKAVLIDGTRCDLYTYSILKDEYINKELPWQ